MQAEPFLPVAHAERTEVDAAADRRVVAPLIAVVVGAGGVPSLAGGVHRGVAAGPDEVVVAGDGDAGGALLAGGGTEQDRRTNGAGVALPGPLPERIAVLGGVAEALGELPGASQGAPRSGDQVGAAEVVVEEVGPVDATYVPGQLVLCACAFCAW